jgi:hypothetical protein
MMKAKQKLSSPRQFSASSSLRSACQALHRDRSKPLPIVVRRTYVIGIQIMRDCAPTAEVHIITW